MQNAGLVSHVDDHIMNEELNVFYSQEIDDGGGVVIESILEEIDSPIKDLKEVVLSLDWEINSLTMARFHEQINYLERHWEKENILLAFLRILRALGNYISILQSATDPSVVRLLYSVYNGLEKVVLSPSLRKKRKIEIVQGELRKYNDLRKKIGHTPVPNIHDTVRNGSGKERKGSVISMPINGAKLIPKKESVQVVSMEGYDASSADDDLVDLLGGCEAGVEKVTADNSPVLDLGGPGGTDFHGAEERSRPEWKQDEILDGLYNPRRSSVADDLLAEMHLGVFQDKGNGNSGNGGNDFADPAGLLGAPQDDGSTFVSIQKESQAASNPDISRCLDDFFGEDLFSSLNNQGVLEGLEEDSVIPLFLDDSNKPSREIPLGGETVNDPRMLLQDKVQDQIAPRDGGDPEEAPRRQFLHLMDSITEPLEEEILQMICGEAKKWIPVDSDAMTPLNLLNVMAESISCTGCCSGIEKTSSTARELVALMVGLAEMQGRQDADTSIQLLGRAVSIFARWHDGFLHGLMSSHDARDGRGGRKIVNFPSMARTN